MIDGRVSLNVDARFSEIHKLLTHIRSLESTDLRERDSVSGEIATILRGLFFVQLYGAFEYAVTLSVQVLLQEINNVSVPHCGFEPIFHSVALDAQFKAVSDTGSKWPNRKKLLEKQFSNDKCTLDDNLFKEQLQNIWYDTLAGLFQYLCIPSKPVPEDRLRGYIDEIVDSRNAVAHGRKSTSEVGRLKTISDIEKRLDAMTKITDHIISCFDDLLINRRFVASSHRPNFLLPQSEGSLQST
jgi:RiboL-PSP-HEPN